MNENELARKNSHLETLCEEVEKRWKKYSQNLKTHTSSFYTAEKVWLSLDLNLSVYPKKKYKKVE